MTIVSRAGDTAPAHLFITSDDEKTVVSVLQPDLVGTTDPDTVGPVTLVNAGPVKRTRPGGVVEDEPARVWVHTPNSGGASIAGWGSVYSALTTGFAVGATGYSEVIALGVAGAGSLIWWGRRRIRRVRRLWEHGNLVLSHRDDIDAVYAAASAVRCTAELWPRLTAYVDLDDPSPALARHLWDLTHLLTQRAATRQNRDDLTAAVPHVSPEGETAAELGERLRLTEADLSRMDAEVEERIGYLRRLADETSAFVTAQEALASARAALRRYDHPAASVAGAAGTAGELVEETTAVLAAYRELTRE